MKSYIFLLILVIISCNNIEKQTEDDLILKDAISDFLGQIANVVDNCGFDIECIAGQVGDVWNGLSDEQKDEMKNAGIGAVQTACGFVLEAHPIAGGICEAVCVALKIFF